MSLVAADSQFSCIWKLNVAKSKFTDGLAPKLHGKPSAGMGKLRSEDVEGRQSHIVVRNRSDCPRVAPAPVPNFRLKIEFRRKLDVAREVVLRGR